MRTIPPGREEPDPAAAAPRERFVYFIQSHRAPAQVARLVRTIKRSSPASCVLVGHDGRSVSLERRDLPDLPGVDLFTVRGPVERGELTLLSPYFQAVEKLAREGVDYDWLVHLSGQDYPTKPLACSERALADSGSDGYLRHWEAFRADNPWGRKRQGRLRYGYRYFRPDPKLAPIVAPLKLLNGVQTLVHLHTTYGPHLGVRRFRTPFRGGFECFAGTQWSSLRRECVEYVAAAIRDQSELFAYYARTICADESILHTILLNADRFRFENDSHRFLDFAGSRDGSPRTLGETDLPNLLSGAHHFARKFDADVDSAVLDRLDEHLFAS